MQLRYFVQAVITHRKVEVMYVDLGDYDNEVLARDKIKLYLDNDREMGEKDSMYRIDVRYTN